MGISFKVLLAAEFDNYFTRVYQVGRQSILFQVFLQSSCLIENLEGSAFNS